MFKKYTVLLSIVLTILITIAPISQAMEAYVLMSANPLPENYLNDAEKADAHIVTDDMFEMSKTAVLSITIKVSPFVKQFF
jgi:hypothetical protein